ENSIRKRVLARSMGYRFATLALAVPAAAPALAQTKSAEEPGHMTIDAEHIEGVSEIEFTARGNAEIKRDELSIFGDVLRYNAEFGRIEGDGGVRMQQGVDR